LISPKVTHHFTVDVEEYFQVSALEPYVRRSDWDSLESRVVASTMQIVDMLGQFGHRGTFFTLGWVAERAPALVKDNVAAGHEIASHGWDHRRVTDETPQEFRTSVRRSKTLLEDLTGMPVLGYRAPSFSIVKGREWALDILLEEGYAYDSSLFPIRRPGYGYASARRDVHVLDLAAGPLTEVPPLTLKKLGVNLPAAGGAYLRLLPLRLVRSALVQAEKRSAPATLYIHPWELDIDQPRVNVPLKTRIRHYGGLRRTAPRLQQLFRQFRFGTIAESLPALAQRA
jgi:polysaccharide deacetylase family protein (PEP-CTERM system associated)